MRNHPDCGCSHTLCHCYSGLTLCCCGIYKAAGVPIVVDETVAPGTARLTQDGETVATIIGLS